MQRTVLLLRNPELTLSNCTLAKVQQRCQFADQIAGSQGGSEGGVHHFFMLALYCAAAFRIDSLFVFAEDGAEHT